MNIFTDFFEKQLLSAASDDRPGADALRLALNTDDHITIYMNAEDAKIYATAINRAKLQCLARRLKNANPQSTASTPEKLLNIS